MKSLSPALAFLQVLVERDRPDQLIEIILCFVALRLRVVDFFLQCGKTILLLIELLCVAQ